ncbi:MAG: metallopeptidase family protein [Pseudomonadota bacterium]
MTIAQLHNPQISNLPAIQRLEQIAQQTLKTIPDALKEYAKKIQIVVENYADKETLNSLRIDDKYELLGLYRGTPVPIKTVFAHSTLPDSIFLYRCPLIRYSIENQEKIETLVQHVMMHELGHHFGYNSNDEKW